MSRPRGAGTGEQPDHMPPGLLVGVAARSVTMVDFSGAEMRDDRNGLHRRDSFQAGRPMPIFLSITARPYEAGEKCGLLNGGVDPMGGGTVQLTPDHKTPHSVDPTSDPNDLD